MRAPRDEEGHSRDVGQGGWFGDYEGHSEIGRRGGEVRHERAMRTRHDMDEPDERGSRYSDERGSRGFEREERGYRGSERDDRGSRGSERRRYDR